MKSNKNIIDYTFIKLCLVFIVWSTSLASGEKIGSISYIEGDIQILDLNSGRTSKGFEGRNIYSSDIVRSSKSSLCKIIYDDSNTLLIIDQYSEVKLSENKLSRSFALNYGSMYIKNMNNSAKKTMLFTDASQYKIDEADIWINLIGDSGDEFYLIKGASMAYNYTSKSKVVGEIGYVIYSYKDGFFDTINYDVDELPNYIDDEKLIQLESKIVTLSENISYKSHDLVPLYDGSGTLGASEDFDRMGFGYNLKLGSSHISPNQYFLLGVSPSYNSMLFDIELNFNGYISMSDNSRNMNQYTDFFDILNNIEHFKYKSYNENFIIQLGNIWGLTFGHGNLLKEYSNMLDFPRVKKTGLYLFYRTNRRDIKFDMFISDLEEFTSSSGLFGLRGSIFLSEKFPLTLGFGIIQDNNQFSSISDYIDDPQTFQNLSFSRKVSSFEFDYSFDLFNGEFLDTKMYGEFVGVLYPESIYYIRDNRTIEDQGDYVDEIANLDADLQFKRKGSWEIANGFWFHFREKFQLKGSLNFTSALHIPQYFSTTYDFEKARPFQLIPSENREFNPGAQHVQAMLINYIYDGNIEEQDSVVMFIFPKEIYSMMNATQIKYPAVGISINSEYYFRDIIDISLNFSYYKEIDENEFLEEDFFNYHFSLNLKDNMIEGVSEARLYYTQFLTDRFFDNRFQENLLRGIRLGYNFWKNCYFIVDIHDVFYDRDLDNEVDILRTTIAEIKVAF